MGNQFKEFDKEITKRVKIMESPSYDYSPPLSRGDYIGVICVLGLIWGVN